jgi:predicted enzyme related to lactoylglutathione lyase
MKIKVTSVIVNDQNKALKFYTEKLGFVKKNDIPLGEYKWLTVVSPEEQDGVELLLEPDAFEPAKVFQKALFDAGMAAAMFNVDDINSEYLRLQELGVEFTMTPTDMGTYSMAVFNDTCGNKITMVQML